MVVPLLIFMSRFVLNLAGCEQDITRHLPRILTTVQQRLF